jgi:hypothetical protein
MFPGYHNGMELQDDELLDLYGFGVPQLEGFHYETSLDLNMDYYCIELSPFPKQLCTIMLPFGKYEYQHLPMGLCNFSRKISELMLGLDYVGVYIDDILVLMHSG